MIGTISRTGAVCFFCMVVMAFASAMPLSSHAEEFPLEANFSPKIINIASNRSGEIRVLTNLSYSTFVADGDSMFIYFNGGSNSVPYIHATRDSLGHLILRFTLEDLLAVESDLEVDSFNNALVVLVMRSGDEYIGTDGEVYIVDKEVP